MSIGQYYSNQPVRYVIGTATTAETLTGAYTDNSTISESKGFVGMTLYLEYTPAEIGRTLSLLVEGSPDGATFYPVVSLKDNAPFDGTALSYDYVKTMVSVGVAVQRQRFVYPLSDIYTRISVKEDGANFGTIKIINIRNGA